MDSIILTKSQQQILEVLQDEYMYCGDIAFKLNKNKLSIGKSLKALIKKEVVGVYYPKNDNPKYFII